MRYKIETLPEFEKWIRKNKDYDFQIAFLKRLERIKNGNFGDVKKLDEFLFELRFFIGPGYRVYYAILDNEIVLLVGGGKKDSQQKDIARAKVLLEQYSKE